jgi:hypothetical protein
MRDLIVDIEEWESTCDLKVIVGDVSFYFKNDQAFHTLHLMGALSCSHEFAKPKVMWLNIREACERAFKQYPHASHLVWYRGTNRHSLSRRIVRNKINQTT